MLKKVSLTVAFAGAMLGATAANASLSLSIDFVPGAAMQVDNYRGGQLVEDFEDETPGAAYGGGLAIFANSVPGQAARPAFHSTGNFLAVQANNTSSVTITVPQTQMLSFIIGSLDTYNQLILYFLNSDPITLDGSQIIAPFLTQANGNQVSPNTNGRVFYDTLGTDSIVGFELTSFGSNAFEIDNVVVAAPEPATWGMMILAAGMAGAALRRRRNHNAMA